MYIVHLEDDIIGDIDINKTNILQQRTGQSVDSWTDRENWRHMGRSEAQSNMSQKLTIHKKVHSLSRPHRCHYK